jgi:hypothetical protein
MSAGSPHICPQCGAYMVGWQQHYCYQQPRYGSYTWTPAPITADEVRRIVREELERHRAADMTGAAQ